MLDIERSKDDKVLCAYYVGKAKETELKNYLLSTLPGYMVPGFFVKIDAIPVSPSGKANRKALPKPDFNKKNKKLCVPENEKEMQLLEVFRSVLNIGEISTDDNYFEIGGDSIKALQIVSLLRKNHMEFTMQQLFANPTIKQLAKIITTGREMDKENKEFSGTISLAPIQKRFMERYDGGKFFNQSILLENVEGWNAELVKAAQGYVIRKHPMLRGIYRMHVEQAEDIQEICSFEESFIHFNICAVEYELNDAIKDLQSRISLESNIFEVTVLEAGMASYLFIAAHHIVVDGVSMRIIVNDLINAYHQLITGKAVDIGTELLTYKDYIDNVKTALDSYELKQQKSYWNNINQYKKKSLAVTTSGQMKTCRVELDGNDTESLTVASNRAYGTRAEEMILAAFILSLKETALVGSDDLVIDMESMGRNLTDDEMDFSETVGWFTALYPVCFSLKQTRMEETIIEVKETIRSVPEKGVRYQLLYDTVIPDGRMCFNYLGELSAGDTGEDIHIKSIDNRSMIHPDMPMPYEMEVSAGIINQKLSVSFDYSLKAYGKAVMEEFAAVFAQRCRDIASCCTARKNVVKTPADFGRSELSMQELNAILKAAGGRAEKIYPLAPTQAGMLFHSIAERENGVYFEQNYLTLQGKLDIENFKKAYIRLVDNYDIFRTLFLYDNLKNNYQVVKPMENMEILFDIKEIVNCGKEEQNRVIKEYCIADRKLGFNLQKGPLMRVAAFHVEEDKWKIVWSDHHILMDGWCLAIILNKLTGHYNALCKGQEMKKEQIYQYGNYIDWLQKQDMEKAAGYWKEQVGGYKKPNDLYKGGRGFGQEELRLKLDKELGQRLTSGAADRKLTLNSVMQAAWAVTLMRYCDTNDIIYGSVFSGRSADVDGISDMVGLFISTLPVRAVNTLDLSFSDIARQIQDSCAKADAFSYYPLASIQKYSEYAGELFDHIFVFENFDFLGGCIGKRIRKSILLI